MPVLSLPFAALVLLAALSCRVLPGRSRAAALLGANLVYSASCGPVASAALWGSALLCFAVSQAVENWKARGREGAARAALLLAVALECALMLALGGRRIGVSFFALMHLSYLLEVYAGEIAAQRDLIRFAAAASFFPIVAQGPIMDSQTVADRMDCARGASYARTMDCLLRILSGMVKKLVLADRLAVFVDAVFAEVSAFGAPVLAAAMLGYAIQLYADFSGCMDIVIGAAGLMGIQLDENFRQPYLARSFSDYWRRWHITMGAWFRRHVFYPIATAPVVMNRAQAMSARVRSRWAKRIAAALVPVLVTWLLTGLWHGAAGHYLLWGAANGLLILWEGSAENAAQRPLPDALRVMRTFVIGLFVRVLFRARSLDDAWVFYAGLLRFGAGRGLLSCGLDAKDFALCAVFALLLLLRDLWAERGGSMEGLSAPVKAILGFLGVAALAIFGCYGPGYDPAEFFYSRF